MRNGRLTALYLNSLSPNESQNYGGRDPNVKQARDRQLAALHVTHEVTSAPQELVFTHIAELIIRDLRSVVSTAQSIIIMTSSPCDSFMFLQHRCFTQPGHPSGAGKISTNDSMHYVHGLAVSGVTDQLGAL